MASRSRLRYRAEAMPGIYGPPRRERPEPVRSARPDRPVVKVLRWLGTITLLIAAMALYVYVELQQGPSEQEQQLLQIQQRVEQMSRERFDFEIRPLQFEPLETADIIPRSAIHPAGALVPVAPRKPVAPLETASPTPALQTAELIPP